MKNHINHTKPYWTYHESPIEKSPTEGPRALGDRIKKPNKKPCRWPLFTRVPDLFLKSMGK